MPDGRTAIFMGITETGSSGNWTVEVFDPAKPLGNELDTLSGTIARFGNGTDVVLYPKTFWLPSGRGYVVGPSKLNSFFMRAPAPLDFTRTDAGDPLRERTYATGVLLPLAFDSGAGRVMVAGGSSHPNNDDDPGNDVPGANNFLRRAGRRLDGALRRDGQPLDRRAVAQRAARPPQHRAAAGLRHGHGGRRRGRQPAVAGQRLARRAAGGAVRRHPLGARARAGGEPRVPLDGGAPAGRQRAVRRRRQPAGDGHQPAARHVRDLQAVVLLPGARPAITAAPAATGYAATFPVGTPNTDVARAVLAAPGAATHATDMSQRIVTLPVTRRADGSGYDVRSPANRNIALPGHYMLFLVDAGAPVGRHLDRAGHAGRTRRGDRYDRARRECAQPGGRGERCAGRQQRERHVQRGRPGRGDLTFTLRSASGADVPAAVTQAAGAEWILDPSIALAPSTTYTVTLAGGTTGGVATWPATCCHHELVVQDGELRRRGGAVGHVAPLPGAGQPDGVARRALHADVQRAVQGVSTTPLKLQRITSGLGTTPVTLIRRRPARLRHAAGPPRSTRRETSRRTRATA